MRIAVALLAGIVIGFAGDWAAFRSGDDGSGSSSLTRAQAEQAVIREGDDDVVRCQETGAGDFSCAVFARQIMGPKEGELLQVSTVRVYLRNGKAVIEGARP